MRLSPSLGDAGVRGYDLAVHVAVPDMVVRVDHIAHGRLLGLVGHDDRLVGTFAEPVVQVDAVLFELAGEDAFDLFSQPGDVSGSGDVDLRAERSRAYGHGSRDVFGMVDEQSVGVDAVAEFGGVRPCCVRFGQRLVTFAQDQDVGDYFGARLPVERLPWAGGIRRQVRPCARVRGACSTCSCRACTGW